jgi:hypothetical protein
MSPTIRPTLLLRMSLDAEQFDEPLTASLKRSYLYIAPLTITSHERQGDSPENMIRFLVRLPRSYWWSFEEGADELWREVMLKWLENIFYKLSNNLVSYNKVAREKGDAEVPFSWLELEFKDLVVALRLQSDSSIPASALELVDRARTYSNSGVLGASDIQAARVRIPSRSSFAAQLQAAQEAAVQGVAAQEASAQTSDADKDELAEDAPKTPAEPVAFETDYSIWGIEDAAGNVRELDSVSAKFIVLPPCPNARIWKIGEDAG